MLSIDVWMGLIKPFSRILDRQHRCHVGMRTRGGTQGVGGATTNAVVAASIAALAANFFLERLRLHDTPATHNLHEQHERNDQQDVNERFKGVATHKAE